MEAAARSWGVSPQPPSEQDDKTLLCPNETCAGFAIGLLHARARTGVFASILLLSNQPPRRHALGHLAGRFVCARGVCASKPRARSLHSYADNSPGRRKVFASRTASPWTMRRRVFALETLRRGRQSSAAHITSPQAQRVGAKSETATASDCLRHQTSTEIAAPTTIHMGPGV